MRRSGLRDLAVLPPRKMIPANWLSCAPHGPLIQSPSDPNAKFLPIKTPLPEHFNRALGSSKWSITDVKATIASLGLASHSELVAVNVSSAMQVVGQLDWESAGVKYVRFPVKRSYDKLCLDPFITFVDSQAAIGPSLFLIYSGKGLNRVSYCLAGYLGRTMPIGDAISNFGLNFYKQKPLSVLTEVIYPQPPVQSLTPPDFLEFDDGPLAIGQIPLSLEKYKGIKRVSPFKRAASDTWHSSASRAPRG
jgi:hypothetical protein